MPGRQAHGRSLLANAKAKSTGKKSKSRAQKTVLNAFGISQAAFPARDARTPRARELDAQDDRKHSHVADGDEDAGEGGDSAPRRKRAKALSRPVDEDDAEYGSDSEGNEWRLGGLAEDDNDSEIESDDAFGDSENETFQGYAFRGSRLAKEHDSGHDSGDEEGDTLGADAIDLATALDQFDEMPVENALAGNSEASPNDPDDGGSGDSDDSSDLQDDETEEEEADPKQLKALQGLIAEYGDDEQDPPDAATRPQAKQKIDLGDLGLSGLSDPFMRKLAKLLKKEEKEKRPGGTTKKLDAPLAKRQQDRLDRAAAYDKTNETLNRWMETVKQNRRAEYLVFPLPQNSGMAGLDTTEIQPLSTAQAGANELEFTIMAIMEKSGLSLRKESKPKPQEVDEEGNLLSRTEALNRRRMQREFNAREAKRAKRIKKIKSKAYHRVHRKQRERDDMAAREAMEEAGEIDSEAEREAQDRRRLLERVGQRHKESQWAKAGSKTKRAVWDDDFRVGLAEMALKDEELRRRKQGKKAGDGDSDSDDSSEAEDEDEDGALRQQLGKLETELAEEDGPYAKLRGLRFMQRAEAAQRKADDDLIQQIRKELDGDEAADSDTGVAEVGRRSFGGNAAGGMLKPAPDTTASRRAFREGNRGGDALGKAAPTTTTDETAPRPAELDASTTGAWSRGAPRRSTTQRPGVVGQEDLDLGANVLLAERKARAKPPRRPGRGEPADDDDEKSSQLDETPALDDSALVARAFAGEDVVAEFEREKAAVAESDDDQLVDSTLPGWGSWVGDGVSSHDKACHHGRFLTRIQGVKAKDRRDSKLDRVIISEKRAKKTDRYLASQLPHPFESRHQYERSLRLPLGPEWITKQTFQDATRPRLLIKQGVIAPISKPTV